MDKETFLNQYIVTFLASYAAEQYDFNCAHGRWHDHNVEDAMFLAGEAWDELQKHR